ncbi:MAG TPA: DMP19 family protein [Pyrinomonadaceae bacterium]|nr:DMP19 family protein [Pyrinomonadaceae bacterium]
MTTSISFNIGDSEIQGDDYFTVIEPVFWTVNIYDGPERYEEDLANFSAEQRLVLAYHWYLSEVNNGGHDQFYYNTTGIVWPDALKAFREIGHSEVVAIINKSISRLGGSPSLNRDERMEQMERLEPNFDDLDQELFRLEERADFDEKVLQYIRTHRESFLFSGVVEKP